MTDCPRNAIALALMILVPAFTASADDERETVTVVAGGPVVIVPVDDGSFLALHPDVDYEFRWIDRSPPEAVEIDLATRKGEDGFEALDGRSPGSVDREIYLRIEARACCEAGNLTGQLRFTTSGEVLARTPLRLVVVASPWRCHRPWLLGLSGFLVCFLSSGMVLRSRLLPTPKRILKVVAPARWSPEEDRWTGDIPRREALLRGLERALRPHKRVAAWLRSNPLRLAVPGKYYAETLRIDPVSLAVRLEPDTPSQRSTRRRAGRGGGRIYLVADGQDRATVQVGVRSNNRVGRFTLEGPGVSPSREEPELVPARLGHDQLVDRTEDRSADGHPGWIFGDR